MNVKHNLAGTVEYRAWWHMVRRCTSAKDPNYPHYGARGITVWEGWLKDPAAFVEHVGPRPSNQHSIGRIKNNRGYEPGNVRWETPSEQARNRRTGSEVRGVRPYIQGYWRVSTPRHPKTKKFFYLGYKFKTQEEGALVREEWLRSNWPSYPNGEPLTEW